MSDIMRITIKHQSLRYQPNNYVLNYTNTYSNICKRSHSSTAAGVTKAAGEMFEAVD